MPIQPLPQSHKATKRRAPSVQGSRYAPALMGAASAITECVCATYPPCNALSVAWAAKDSRTAKSAVYVSTHFAPQDYIGDSLNGWSPPLQVTADAYASEYAIGLIYMPRGELLCNYRRTNSTSAYNRVGYRVNYGHGVAVWGAEQYPSFYQDVKNYTSVFSTWNPNGSLFTIIPNSGFDGTIDTLWFYTPDMDSMNSGEAVAPQNALNPNIGQQGNPAAIVPIGNEKHLAFYTSNSNGVYKYAFSMSNAYRLLGAFGGTHTATSMTAYTNRGVVALESSTLMGLIRKSSGGSVNKYNWWRSRDKGGTFSTGGSFLSVPGSASIITSACIASLANRVYVIWVDPANNRPQFLCSEDEGTTWV